MNKSVVKKSLKVAGAFAAATGVVARWIPPKRRAL